MDTGNALLVGVCCLAALLFVLKGLFVFFFPTEYGADLNLSSSDYEKLRKIPGPGPIPILGTTRNCAHHLHGSTRAPVQLLCEWLCKLLGSS